jgi:flagellar motor switch protein FliG
MSATAVVAEKHRNSGIQRAAMLLVALGPDASSAVLRHMNPKEIETVAAAMSAMGPLPQTEAGAVLDAFEREFVSIEIPAFGGPEYAKSLLAKTFGEEFAHQLSQRFPPPERQISDSMKAVSSADPEQLARLLEKENPQTTAILASALAPGTAARVIQSLPPEQQAEVMLRVATLRETSAQTVEMIAAEMTSRLRTATAASRTPSGGLQTVAEILNQLEPEIGNRVLEKIESESTQTAEAIRKMLFVFEDIAKFDQKSMRELVGRIDRKLLVLGLKGTTEEFRNHFLSVLSKNGAAMLLEDMEALGPVRIKEVEGAQQGIITTIRQLESEGVLDLKSTGGEQYVV